MKKLHDWLRLTRISNLPTCITNVMTGCGLGILSLPSGDPGPWIDPVRFTLVLAGVCAFYLAGMILNDVVDATRDAVEAARAAGARGSCGPTRRRRCPG